jgi:hypothetical protein
MVNMIAVVLLLAATLSNIPGIVEGNKISIAAGIICFFGSIANFIMGIKSIEGNRTGRKENNHVPRPH